LEIHFINLRREAAAALQMTSERPSHAREARSCKLAGRWSRLFLRSDGRVVAKNVGDQLLREHSIFRIRVAATGCAWHRSAVNGFGTRSRPGGPTHAVLEDDDRDVVLTGSTAELQSFVGRYVYAAQASATTWNTARNGREGETGVDHAAESLDPNPCLVLMLALAAGCSVKKIAINKLGNALASGGTTFNSDEDPSWCGTPFLQPEADREPAGGKPAAPGLALCGASGFTPYAYAFVQQEADEIEDRDLAKATALRSRARRLYLRARDYGIRGLEVKRPKFGAALRQDAKVAVRAATKADVPLLYWTAASWGAAISFPKTSRPGCDQPIVEALIDRTLELDEKFGDGAIHSFLVTYERAETERKEISRCGPETFRSSDGVIGRLSGCSAREFSGNGFIQKQDRIEFQSLLETAVAIDVNAKPSSGWRT